MPGSRMNCPKVAAKTVSGYLATRRKSSAVSSIPTTTTVVKKIRTGTPASTTIFSNGPPMRPATDPVRGWENKPGGSCRQHLILPCFSCLDRYFKRLRPSGRTRHVFFKAATVSRQRRPSR